MRKLIDPMEWNDETKQPRIDPMEWFDDVAQAPVVPEVNVGNLSDTSIISVEQTATSKHPLTEPMVWNTPTKQAGSSSATVTLTTAPSSSPASGPEIVDTTVIRDPQDKVKMAYSN